MCGNFPPARTPICLNAGRITALLATPFLAQGENKMRKNIRDVLFGFRTRQNTESAAAADALKKEKALASVNETDTNPVQPRTYRTIGLTEARLRARNKESWMTSTRGWSDFFGRFMRSAKA